MGNVNGGLHLEQDARAQQAEVQRARAQWEAQARAQLSAAAAADEARQLAAARRAADASRVAQLVAQRAAEQRLAVQQGIAQRTLAELLDRQPSSFFKVTPGVGDKNMACIEVNAQFDEDIKYVDAQTRGIASL